MPGRYSAALTPSTAHRVRFRHCATGRSRCDTLAHAPAMRIYWFASAIGALRILGAIGSVVRDVPRRQPVHPLLDQPAEAEA